MYIMSDEKNKEEDPELSNSQESTTTYPSEALIEKDSELTAKKPAEERKVVVVKPSEVEYKENNQIENSSSCITSISESFLVTIFIRGFDFFIFSSSTVLIVSGSCGCGMGSSDALFNCFCFRCVN